MGKEVHQTIQCHDHFLLGDVHARALVRPEPESQMILRRTERIIAIRITPSARIAIGGAEAHVDPRAFGDRQFGRLS